MVCSFMREGSKWNAYGIIYKSQVLVADFRATNALSHPSSLPIRWAKPSVGVFKLNLIQLLVPLFGTTRVNFMRL